MLPAASSSARNAAFTASELPKRSNTSGSTSAIAKDRRARAAYRPRGSRRIAAKSTSGTSMLRKLERQRFNVFGPRPPRLNKGQKLLLILQAWCRFACGAMATSYGA